MSSLFLFMGTRVKKVVNPCSAYNFKTKSSTFLHSISFFPFRLSLTLNILTFSLDFDLYVSLHFAPFYFQYFSSFIQSINDLIVCKVSRCTPTPTRPPILYHPSIPRMYCLESNYIEGWNCGGRRTLNTNAIVILKFIAKHNFLPEKSILLNT
jgi:hypothetical protein